MKTDKHFKLITCESGVYEVLLEDGELFTCGVHIGNNAWISILRSLGCTVEEVCISNEEMEKHVICQ